MSKDFTSGAEPEQLRQLFSIGMDESSSEEPIDRTASLDLFMEKPGSRLGRYQLLSVLGEGGMGMVYLAEQEGQIRRKVALKVIKPGMDSKRVIARFETERQALALLDHPGIAQVYDAGTTPTGRPYFVMEHVRGLPITDYCDRHKLTIEERLRLFQQVCLAVHHAHQKGIIHRDIKPSNILVSAENDRPIPKIIDFGVAKAISQPLTERTLFTEDSQLLGTPEYMSPEQAEMVNEDIDTRSDIYSLGVLLYVLLAGILPYDSQTFRQGGVEHIRKTIRETDPKTPSTRLTKLGEEAKKVAESRRTEVAALAKCLHKELEWIPLKAMRKDRSERYRSASELADDIENYLKGDPLIAGPPGTGYRLKKFVRRNRVLVGGIAVVLAVLVGGVVVSTLFAIRADHARAEAQLIADFLENDVIGSASQARIGEATVSYILDAASKSLESRFKDKPLIEASIHEKLGASYRVLGESDKTEHHFLRAIELRQEYLGEEHPDTVEVMHRLGYVYEDQGRYHDMERLSAKIFELDQRTSGMEYPAGAVNLLAVAKARLGKYEEAESLFNKALQSGSTWPYIKLNLAGVYRVQGRYEEAEQLLRNTIEDVVDAEYGVNLRYTTALANVYRDWGRYDKAEPLFVKTLEALRQIKGNEHFLTVLCMYGLVRLYVDQDRFEEAQKLFDEALPIARRRLRENHPVTLRFVNAYAVFHRKQKQYAEAETFFAEALKGRQRELGDDHPDTLETKNDLAVLYKEQARYEEAEKLLLEAVEGRRLKLGDKHPHTLESISNLIALYEAWNKPEKAEQWQAKLKD